LESKVSSLEKKVSRPAAGVRASAPVAIRAVRDELQLRAKLRNAADPDVADPAVDRLLHALSGVHGARETSGVVWRLAKQEFQTRRRLHIVITFVVLLVVMALAALALRWTPAVTVLSMLGAAAVTCLPALQGAARVLSLARNAREARELPLVIELEKLARARQEEAEAELDVQHREEELTRLRDRGQRLHDFVRERASSSDYGSRLGVISQLRQDFEQLAGLLPHPGKTGSLPQGAEEVLVAAEAVTQRVGDVDRIVLFIDDLDRCLHDKVVEVLQAVHLLLAFKLFLVVVGVDSRWLEPSLTAHYENLLEEPDSYLEKIFQIPFTLSPTSRSRYHDLVDKVAPLARPETVSPTAAEDDAETDTGRPPAEASTSGADKRAPSLAVGPSPPPPVSLPRPEALVITREERHLLRELGGIVPTPRAVKRLVNIYRMLRVGVPEDELEAFGPGGRREYQAALLLLTVLVGRPLLVERLFGSIMAPGDDDAWAVLQKFPELAELLTPLGAEISVWDRDVYRRWAPRVARFSFRFALTRSLSSPESERKS
jgi:hypothetical protein